MTRTLWGLSYSPWTEKARWALDHHGLDYRFREHQPLLGEPGLRWRARGRAPETPASVPLLLDGEVVLGDSTLIARHADAHGGGAPLFGPERDAEIERWLAASDAALQAVRVLVIVATLASPAAQAENLPAYVPGPLRPAMRGVAVVGTRFLLRKYGGQLADPAEMEAEASATVGTFLAELEAALDGPYLLGELSYADFACAMVVNGVAPLRERFFRTKPAIAATWARPSLSGRHPALVDWRDALYAKHR